MAGRRVKRSEARAPLLVLVLALASPACMGDGGSEPNADPPATTSVEAAPTTVLPPSGFAARPGTFAVRLTWTAPPGEAEVDGYALYRDGFRIARVSGSDLAFRDDDVVPGRRYAYEIEAEAGDLVSERAAVDARTRVPPLGAARVEGTFNVPTKELSASGYERHPEPTYGWRFRPRCRGGACDVRWRDLRMRRVRADFRRSGRRYRASYSGPFNVRCGETEVSSSVTIRFRVERARVIGAEWVATRLVGTLEQSEAPQLGCVGSQARLSFRARLFR